MRLQELHSAPTYFQDSEVVIYQQSQQHTRDQQEFNSERVMVVVVGSAELQIHQVEGSKRWDDKYELHKRIVQTNVGCEEVEIAAEIDDGEKDLWFAGNA